MGWSDEEDNSTERRARDNTAAAAGRHRRLIKTGFAMVGASFALVAVLYVAAYLGAPLYYLYSLGPMVCLMLGMAGIWNIIQAIHLAAKS